MLTATGLASDPKVSKVTLETSEGRTLAATMYGRFWIVDSDASERQEKVVRTFGYDQHGTILYQNPPFAMVKGAVPIKGPADIPEGIVKDFYSGMSIATDVQWQLLVQEGDRTVVGVTFRAPNRYGEVVDMYCVMVYGPHAKRLWSTVDGLQDRGLETGGGYFVGDRNEWEKMQIRMGVCMDERVVRVIVETDAGRTLEAKMYGRFWIMSAERVEGPERVTRIVACDADGTELYEKTFAYGGT